jgi:serine/threonine protein kinase
MQPQKLGPYRIVRKLGEGGMGAVYEAVDDPKSLRAAVKVLPEALAKKQGFRARFDIEIEALRKLEHPNIVRILGFGEQDGTLFYAMELVAGKDLESVLEYERRITAARTIDIGIQLARALKHAHDRGIIHRDIKPANIMLLPDGTIKLSDFGIAKRYGNTGLTMEGGPIGTANYMSPEQTEGKKATERSDLYSVGCLFYSLLAGRPPFVSESLFKILELQRKARPELVTIYAPQTPEPFAALIDQLLEKEPDKRPANCGVLLRMLTMLQQGLVLTGTPPAPPTPPARPQFPQATPQKPPADSVAPMAASGQSPRSFLNNMGEVTVSTSAPYSPESEPGFNTRNIEGAGPANLTSSDQTLATNSGNAPKKPASRAPDPPSNMPTPAPFSQHTLAPDSRPPAGQPHDPQAPESTMVSGFVAPFATPNDLGGRLGDARLSRATGDSDIPSGHIATGDTSMGPGEGATLVSGAGLNARHNDPSLPTFVSDPGPGPGGITSDSIIELNTAVPDIAPPPRPQVINPRPVTPKKPAPIGAGPSSLPLEAPAPAPNETSTFVTAEQAAEADLQREAHERKQAPATPIIGRGTLIFLILACVVSALWVYFTRPASADKLYRNINAAAATSNPDALEEVDGEIREFLNRFPSDERAPQIKALNDEVDLIKTERRLLIKSRRLTGAFSGTPAQQIYLSALAASRIDPEAGLARFEAFIGLYEAGVKRTQNNIASESEADEEARETLKYLELARRRARQLKLETAQQMGSQITLIRRQLDMAQKSAPQDPARARKVYESIIVLYSERPWAAAEVAKAREFLTSLPPATQPAQ